MKKRPLEPLYNRHNDEETIRSNRYAIDWQQFSYNLLEASPVFILILAMILAVIASL